MGDMIKLKRGATPVVDGLDGITYPILEEGEPVYDLDTGTLKVGDGVKTYAELRGINADTVDNYHLEDIKDYIDKASADFKITYISDGTKDTTYTDAYILALNPDQIQSVSDTIVVDADEKLLLEMVTKVDETPSKLLKGMYYSTFSADNASQWIDVVIDFELYEAKSDGSQVLLLTSNLTSTITSDVTSFTVSGYLENDVVISDGSRLLIKLIAHKPSEGVQPSITITISPQDILSFTTNTSADVLASILVTREEWEAYLTSDKTVDGGDLD